MLLARMVHIWEISEAKNQVSFLRSLLVPPLHAARHHAWPIESYHDAKCSPSLSVGTNYCLETQGFAPFHLTSKVPSVCTHVNAMMLSPRQQTPPFALWRNSSKKKERQAQGTLRWLFSL